MQSLRLENSLYFSFRGWICRQSLSLLLLALLLGFFLTPDALGAEKPNCLPKVVAPVRVILPRPQDQVWLINTRQVPCSDATAELDIQRLGVTESNCQQWSPAPLAQLLGNLGPDNATVIYVHGNRKDAPGAIVDGLETYWELAGKYPDERSVRFIIWSWPSEKIVRPLKDVRVKAARADDEAFLLASFISQIPEGTPLGVVGFSLGCRIVSGGLHLLEGGQLNGQAISTPKRLPTRAVFWAAAVHNDWFFPGEFHGCALDNVDQTLILVNCLDSVLKYYHLLEPGDHAVALGSGGVSRAPRLRPEIAARIKQVTIEQIVGSEHDSEPFLYNASIAQQTREYALWYQLPQVSSAAVPRQ